VLAQCPGMPTELKDVDASNYREHLAKIEQQFGATLKIAKGNGATSMHPTDGIPEGKPAIVVTV
jgi:hypothetical protein